MSTTHNKLFVDQVYADPSSVTFSVKVKPTTYSEGCTSYPIEPSATDEDLTSFFLKYPMTIDWGDDTISTFDGTKTITVSDFIHYYDTDVEDAEYTVHFIAIQDIFLHLELKTLRILLRIRRFIMLDFLGRNCCPHFQ